MLKTNPLTRCSKVDGAKKKNYALVLTKKIKQDICLLVYLLNFRKIIFSKDFFEHLFLRFIHMLSSRFFFVYLDVINKML